MSSFPKAIGQDVVSILQAHKFSYLPELPGGLLGAFVSNDIQAVLGEQWVLAQTATSLESEIEQYLSSTEPWLIRFASTPPPQYALELPKDRGWKKPRPT